LEKEILKDFDYLEFIKADASSLEDPERLPESSIVRFLDEKFLTKRKKKAF
jgi:hypothetical protein